MKWIIGLDTRPSSQGAIMFATWLRRMSADPHGVELIGLHVLEQNFALMTMKRDQLQDAVRVADSTVRSAVEAAGATSEFASIEVVRATSAEGSLAGALQMRAADGLVLGRQAGHREDAVIVLGPVARRLLRQLPGPVLVVPPTLQPSELGDGPVLCVVRPTPDAVRALGMAREIAASLGRGVELLHVVRVPDGLEQLPGDDTKRAALLANAQSEATLRLKSWLHDNDLGTSPIEIVCGRTVPAIRRHAADTRSPLIVCGSRRLSLYERIFSSSVASELARSCEVPVLVVPPGRATGD